MTPLVTCAMATYGRYSYVCRALAMFLAQDYPNRELVILNNHHEPLYFDHPQVRIYNEPWYPNLGACRNRLLDLARGEYINTFDDDDIHLPWKLSQAVANIGSADAWKPAKSWFLDGPDKTTFAANALESSILFRTEAVRKVRYHEGCGDEHGPLLAKIRVEQADMGYWASYGYTWGMGAWHASGSMGSGQPEKERTESWMANNNDVRPWEPLKPADLLPWWSRIVRAVPAELQNVWMLAALGQGEAGVEATYGLIPCAVDQAVEWANGRRIVACPGCFDVLHPGHVEMLRWAKSQGDFLAVLVNTDSGVASQKGGDRPLIPMAGRVAALCSLDFVDAVIPFEGTDDLPYLEFLNAAVLVKGPDYRGREDSIPQPPGCEVRIAPAGASGKLHSSLIAGGKDALVSAPAHV